MSFHKRFASNVDAVENGKWFDIGDGIRFKARSPRSAHSQATRKELEGEFAALIKMGREIPEKDQDRLFTAQLSKSILIEWEGVTLPTGEKDEKGEDVYAVVPSDEEGFLSVLKNPTYADFKAVIVRVVTDDDAFRAKAREADAKN